MDELNAIENSDNNYEMNLKKESNCKISDGSATSPNPEISVKRNLSLDAYLASHTSEDNESFKEIQKESLKRHKLKYDWLYKDEDNINKVYKDNLKVPSIEEQASGKQRVWEIDSWQYKNKNHCMYVPEGNVLTNVLFNFFITQNFP